MSATEHEINLLRIERLHKYQDGQTENFKNENFRKKEIKFQLKNHIRTGRTVCYTYKVSVVDRRLN